jgi:hypothetical protein
MVRLFIQLNYICLTVLGPAHINGTFAEDLSLHVDSVLSDKSHTSLTSSDAASTRSLSVVLGMGCVELVGLSCFRHFEI